MTILILFGDGVPRRTLLSVYYFTLGIMRLQHSLRRQKHQRLVPKPSKRSKARSDMVAQFANPSRAHDPHQPSPEADFSLPRLVSSSVTIN